MQINSTRFARRSFRLCRCWSVLIFLPHALSFGGVVAEAQEAQQSRELGGQMRLPRQRAQTNAALDGMVRSGPASGGQIPVAGAILQLQNLTSAESKGYFANGEGVFRVFPLAPGDYSLRVRAQGYAAFSLDKITLHANEVLTLEISLLAEPSAELRSRLPRLPELGAPLPRSPSQPREAIGNSDTAWIPIPITR